MFGEISQYFRQNNENSPKQRKFDEIRLHFSNIREITKFGKIFTEF
jgi:hypothetical protein